MNTDLYALDTARAKTPVDVLGLLEFCEERFPYTCKPFLEGRDALTVLFATARELVVELSRQSRPNYETVSRLNAALEGCGVKP